MGRSVLPGILVALAAVGVARESAGQAQMASAPLVAPFSAARAGKAFPPGWRPVTIAAGKTPTDYRLQDDGGVTVLVAHAKGAASALGHPVNFDIGSAPVVEWRWKISGLIDGADNAIASREDSPARIILEFDGDKSKLPLREQAILALAKGSAGHEVPYATLMYVWANKAPVGKVIPNPHTGRVRMVVAQNGPAGVGAWQSMRRNVADDYRRAFGEDPGRLIGVGILTDSDNTGETVDAWYGDIRFGPADR
jgi:hypothetical protein